MKTKKATGGVRLESMRHKIDRPFLWIDTYNQCVNELAGTLKARIDANCMYFVSTNETNMADQKAIELPSELKGKKFRIRKLTPRECFRLMGVDDKDIDKIQAAKVSNSAQYKLAGNSIVVDVLFHIFRRMFIETEEPDFDGTPTQLTLF